MARDKIFHDHVCLSTLSGKYTKNVIYPQNTADDVNLSESKLSNTSLPSSKVLVDLLNKIGTLAFLNTIIDDGYYDDGFVQVESSDIIDALLVVDDSVINSEDYDEDTMINISSVSPFIPDIQVGDYVQKVNYSRDMTWSSQRINTTITELKQLVSDNYVLDDTFQHLRNELEKQISNTIEKIENVRTELNEENEDLRSDFDRYQNDLSKYIDTGAIGMKTSFSAYYGTRDEWEIFDNETVDETWINRNRALLIVSDDIEEYDEKTMIKLSVLQEFTPSASEDNIGDYAKGGLPIIDKDSNLKLVVPNNFQYTTCYSLFPDLPTLEIVSDEKEDFNPETEIKYSDIIGFADDAYCVVELGGKVVAYDSRYMIYKSECPFFAVGIPAVDYMTLEGPLSDQCAFYMRTSNAIIIGEDNGEYKGMIDSGNGIVFYHTDKKNKCSIGEKMMHIHDHLTDINKMRTTNILFGGVYDSVTNIKSSNALFKFTYSSTDGLSIISTHYGNFD